jgi:hypothetical protein
MLGERVHDLLCLALQRYQLVFAVKSANNGLFQLSYVMKRLCMPNKPLGELYVQSGIASGDSL